MRDPPLGLFQQRAAESHAGNAGGAELVFNRQVTACINCSSGSPTATYQYDGNGLRVSKTTSSDTTIYVYDAWGNLAAEYSTATVPSPCGTATCYVTMDQLGSTRMLTDSAGSTSVVRYDYQPFGQEILAGFGGRSTSIGYLGMADGTNPKYTGQERDLETADPNTQAGLDWFNMRYLSSPQGRFQSPDPANAGADLSNPQTWNGFAYVGNNPMSFTDPSGMFAEATGIGAEVGGATCGPVCAGVGAAIGAIVDGVALWGIFGGGGQSTISSSLVMPSSPILGSPGDSNSQDDDLGNPLGLPGVGGNGFMNCSITMKGCPPSSGVVRDLSAWAWGYTLNVAWAYAHLPGRGPAPRNPAPYRWFGTYWCGPGGAGPTGGAVNGACFVHDTCYAAAGLDAGVNTNANIQLKRSQVDAAKACNQALYDSVQGSTEPGSTGIELWLRYGEKSPVRVPYPGTGAHP